VQSLFQGVQFFRRRGAAFLGVGVQW